MIHAAILQAAAAATSFLPSMLAVQVCLLRQWRTACILEGTHNPIDAVAADKSNAAADPDYFYI